MKEKIVVAVDAMGGDNAPAVEVQGAVAAARRWGVSVVLVGDRDRVEDCLAQESTSGLDIRIQHASERNLFKQNNLLNFRGKLELKLNFCELSRRSSLTRIHQRSTQ